MNDYSGRFTLVNGKLQPLVSGEWVAYEYAYKCYMEALSIVGERNDRIAQAQIRFAELEARCAKLQKGYKRAIKDIKEWGAYVAEVKDIEDEHNACIAAHKKALAKGEDHG